MNHGYSYRIYCKFYFFWFYWKPKFYFTNQSYFIFLNLQQRRLRTWSLAFTCISDCLKVRAASIHTLHITSTDRQQYPQNYLSLRHFFSDSYISITTKMRKANKYAEYICILKTINKKTKKFKKI